ncbi:DUF1285 domain-containing protein [Porticoccaceae bacterium]|nr:DUF1285 domain-containing protein [Porticoccaceae bacterium]MDA8899081.1 DUF1285 domain-containing protein [Porticoccaceae bacterium]
MVDKLFSDLLSESKKYSDTLPPIHQWHPELSGDIAIRIDREGRWFHDSVEIKRDSIITLFSKLLKLEESDYFLVTPNEKWRIQVDVAPLFVISASLEIRQGHQAIVCQTLTGDTILIGRDNPLQMKQDSANEQTYPLLLVRDNITALISRATFYQLVDWSISRTHQDGQKEQLIESMGCEFSLGLYSD